MKRTTVRFATLRDMSRVESPPLASLELPVIGSEPRERADAVRNREKVLRAAQCLFARHGVGHVTMEAVAAEAGVGKGTLFRRFGDRASLVRALLSERERAFQDLILRGPPPLGPGASSVERLVAFGRGMVELLEAHGDLLVVAERHALGGRCHSPPYALYRAHVRTLLAQADPAADPEFLADALLAPLSAELYRHLRHERGMSTDDVGEGYERLVRSVVAPSRRP